MQLTILNTLTFSRIIPPRVSCPPVDKITLQKIQLAVSARAAEAYEQVPGLSKIETRVNYNDGPGFWSHSEETHGTADSVGVVIATTFTNTQPPATPQIAELEGMLDAQVAPYSEYYEKRLDGYIQDLVRRLIFVAETQHLVITGQRDQVFH